MLAKHLKRVALARKYVTKSQKYTGIGSGSIEGAVVFSKNVPMIFLITTQAKRNLSSRSGIGGVRSAT